MDRVKIIKNLIEAIFAYIGDDVCGEDIEYHRERLHSIVNEACDKFKDSYCMGGLNDV